MCRQSNTWLAAAAIILRNPSDHASPWFAVGSLARIALRFAGIFDLDETRFTAGLFRMVVVTLFHVGSRRRRLGGVGAGRMEHEHAASDAVERRLGRIDHIVEYSSTHASDDRSEPIDLQFTKYDV